MINIELILAIAFSASTTLLLISTIVLARKGKKLSEELDSKSAGSSESYNKFVNDSRDWAFQYIEEVQSVLNSFIKRAGLQLDYFNKYGKVVNSPHVIMLDEISEAFDELKTLLPDENKQEK